MTILETIRSKKGWCVMSPEPGNVDSYPFQTIVMPYINSDLDDRVKLTGTNYGHYYGFDVNGKYLCGGDIEVYPSIGRSIAIISVGKAVEIIKQIKKETPYVPKQNGIFVDWVVQCPTKENHRSFQRTVLSYIKSYASDKASFYGTPGTYYGILKNLNAICTNSLEHSLMATIKVLTLDQFISMISETTGTISYEPVAVPAPSICCEKQDVSKETPIQLIKVRTLKLNYNE